MKTKKILSALLALIMVLTSVPFAYAVEVKNYGNLDENIEWWVDIECQELHIIGKGDICDFDSKTRPWDFFADQIRFVYIGSDITSIGKYAFYNLYKLKYVHFFYNSHTEKIGDYAFADCTELENIYIPESVREIGKGAFSHCDNLKIVKIYEGTEKIGENAFESFMLSEITIPSTVNEIAENAFTNPVLNIKKIENNSKTAAVSNCTGEYYADEIIADKASFWFSKISAMENENENNEITQAQQEKLLNELVEAFNSEFGTNYINAEEIENIFDNAEKKQGVPVYSQIKCYKESVQHEKCKEVGIKHELYDETCDLECGKPHDGFWADGYCSSCYREIEISDDMFQGQCGDNAYWNYDYDTKTITISGYGGMWDIDEIFPDRPWSMFMVDAEHIVVNDEITYVGNNAFMGFYRVTSLYIGRRVEKIGAYAFSIMALIKEINIPGNVKTIGENAFEGCLTAERINICEGVEEIGDYAFCICAGIHNVVIPSTVTEIGKGNFNHIIPGEIIINNSSVAVYDENNTEDLIALTDKDMVELNNLFAEVIYGFLNYSYNEDVYEEHVLSVVNEKLGTAYTSLWDFEQAISNMIEVAEGTEALAYITIECLEDSVQHEVCIENNITHSIINSTCDDTCGKHNIYTNDIMEPTCTENGYEGGKFCLDCEKIFEPAEVIPATGHTPVKTEGLKPTCTEIGFEDAIVCDVCGELLEDLKLIQATGHTDNNNDGICDTCGEVYEDFEPEPIPETFGQRIINFFKGIVDSILALFRKIFG